MEQTLRFHKSAYLFCAAAYIFFMFVQYFFWLGAKYVSFLVILASLPPFLGQLYCIKMLRFDKPSIYFPASFFCWLAGVFVIFGTDSGAKLISVFTAGPALLGMLLLYTRMMAQQGYTFAQLCLAQQNAVPARRNSYKGQPDSTADRPPKHVEVLQQNFSSLIGMLEEKDRILKASKEILGARSGQQARNGILLTGAPGNGKTELAKALAGELKLPYIELTFGDIASRWVNHTTENMLAIFSQARAMAPCVLMIDEIDSILVKREDVVQADSETPRTVNTFLTEIISLRNSRVIVVAATNNPEKLDRASIREGRFDYKIEVLPPDENARIALIEHVMAKKLPANVKLNPAEIATAARRWNGFSTSRILGICKEVVEGLQESRKTTLQAEDFFAALRKLNGTAGDPVSHAAGFDAMVLPAELRQRLKGIAHRMKNIHEIETAGGSLPTGIVFYGEHPGTGKTECARSLAKETGWAFLSTTSFELLADSKKIDQLYQKALDIRPCIIFIDEANDILKHRAASPHVTAANKLLTIMDGATSQRRDVMFVVATNFVEDIDSAFLRGGRIAEKFHMAPLDEELAIDYLTEIMLKSPARFSERLYLNVYIDQMKLHGIALTVANLREVLQNSINACLNRHDPQEDEVCSLDVETAVKAMAVL
jgi:transitional endoplasmic reticulum ATPase